MPKCVIVNSTPLISLAGIGALDILKSVYGQIIIPEAVLNEVTVKGDSIADTIKASRWIKIEKIQDDSNRKMYNAKLHAGEVEVMILAQEKNADIVIIDDNAAKTTAKYLGLNTIGTMAVLLKAKEAGCINSVCSIADKLISNGFYISQNVYDIIRELAGE